MNRCILLLVVFVGTAGQVVRADPPEEKRRAALLQADRDFAAATLTKGIDGWMEFMANDAVRLPKIGGPAVRGKEAVRAADTQLFADPTRRLRWEPAEAGVFDDGQHGFTTGTYRVVKKTAAGEETVATGRYLTWWRQERSGAWRVILDTGTPDAPPAK